MFQWHKKDHSTFWLWLAQCTPKKLVYWCIINEVAKYTIKNPTLHPNSVGAMDLAKFVE